MKDRDQKGLKKRLERVYYDFWMLTRLGESLIEAIELSTGRRDSANEMNLEDKKNSDPHFLRTTSPPVRTQRVGGRSEIFYRRDENALVQHNAQIEAFAIHARALLDFFYHEYHKPRRDDILAKNFFNNGEDWIIRRPPMDENEFKNIRDRVGKQIAHLTYFRNQVPDEPSEKEPWPIAEILDKIKGVFKVFLGIVPNHLKPYGWNIDDLI